MAQLIALYLSITNFVHMRQSARLLMSAVTPTVRSTAASGSQVYDTKRAVDEYLFFHFGDSTNPGLQMPYVFGPKDALDFTGRSARLCSSVAHNNGRALDIGCSVGGSSFELSRYFDEVVGVSLYFMK